MLDTLIETWQAIHNKLLDHHSFTTLNLVSNARVCP